MNQCACGCGELVTRKWKLGHNPKSHPYVGPVPDPPNPGGMCLCGCGERAPVAKITSTRDGHVRGEPVKFIRGHGTKLITGEKSSQWKGGRTINSEGYVMIRVGRKYRQEHRIVMEEALGRSLESWEQVHHKNGDKRDNRLENLELWLRSQPSGIRASDGHCPTCTCGG